MNNFPEAMKDLEYRIKISRNDGGGYDVRVDSNRGSSVSYNVTRDNLPSLLNMCLTVELLDSGLVA